MNPGFGRSPGEGKGYPLQYSGLENSTDCIVHGVTESDMTERLSLSCIGEGNGNPLQCSCLENPRDGWLPSMWLCRVGHDLSDLAAAAAGSLEKQESSRETLTYALLTTLKPLTVWIKQTVGNSERDGNTRPPGLPLEKPVTQVRKHQLELDMEQQTGSK